jgi:hypothetical protein
MVTPMPERPNATQALLTRSLDVPLERYVANRRKVGMSWQRIADDMNQQCGTSISGETLRRWFTTGINDRWVA